MIQLGERSDIRDPADVLPHGSRMFLRCRRNFYQIVTLQVDFLLLFRVGNTRNIFVPFQTNVSPRFVTRIGDKLWFRNTLFFFFRESQYNIWRIVKIRLYIFICDFENYELGNNFTFIRNYETFRWYIYSKIIFNLNLSLIKALTYLNGISYVFNFRSGIIEKV